MFTCCREIQGRISSNGPIAQDERLSKTRAICTEDQGAKVMDRNSKIQKQNINNAGCKHCTYFRGALVFVSGRRSVELWIYSWSAGMPELLPNEAVCARKEKEKQGHCFAYTRMHVQLFFWCYPVPS